GRASGSSDELQLMRLAFDRRIFWRHALSAWSLWTSPIELLRSYSASLRHYYTYFVDAARVRSERGQRSDALRAIMYALWFFPIRAIYHLVAPRPLRKALITSISHRGSGTLK